MGPAAILASVALIVVVALAARVGWQIWCRRRHPLRTRTGLGRRPARLHAADRCWNYHLYRPEGVRQPAPTIIALHGGQGSGQLFAAQTGLNSSAARYGFVVAYLDANGPWDDGRATTRDSPAGPAVVAALIDTLVSRKETDPKRVFAVGASSGGMLALRVAVEMPERFAGVVAGLASMPTPAPELPPAKRPVPLLLIHDRHDPVVPWSGGAVRRGAKRGRGGTVAGLAATVRVWLDHPSFRSVTRSVSDGPDTGVPDGVRVVDYRGTTPVAHVRVIETRGLGHVWPGGATRRQVAAGTRRLSASPGKVGLDASVWACHFCQEHASDGEAVMPAGRSMPTGVKMRGSSWT